jgi:hypothetical protein
MPAFFKIYQYLAPGIDRPILVHTGKGGEVNRREGSGRVEARGALVYKRGRKYQHD